MNAITAYRDPIVWGKAALATFVLSGLLATVPLFYQIIEEQLKPINNYLTYHSVEPVKQVFNIGEPLKFYSTREVYQDVNVEWSDALYCDIGDGLGLGTYSIYETGRLIKQHGYFTGSWTYQAEVPERPSHCQLFTTIAVKLKFATKTQFIQSPGFEIK